MLGTYRARGTAARVGDYLRGSRSRLEGGYNFDSAVFNSTIRIARTIGARLLRNTKSAPSLVFVIRASSRLKAKPFLELRGNCLRGGNDSDTAVSDERQAGFGSRI